MLVLGGCGAGKSTLARRLGARLGLPVVHLDAEYFKPGWVEPDPGRWLERVTELVEGPTWVMDGSHVATLPIRLARADTVIVLDLPTWVCLWGVLTRIAAGHGRVRPDSAPGCPERFDLEFILFTAMFRRNYRPRLLAALGGYVGTTVILRTRRDVAAFLSSV